MVYVLAAYTITVGTLALYGLMIRHRQRIATAALVRANGVGAGNGSATDLRRGFNVGAALLAPFWMWAHGLRVAGVVVLALCLAVGPLVEMEMRTVATAVAMIPVAAAAALGFAGNRIALERSQNDDPAAFASSQLPWAVAGVILHVIVLPWAVFLLR